MSTMPDVIYAHVQSHMDVYLTVLAVIALVWLRWSNSASTELSRQLNKSTRIIANVLASRSPLELESGKHFKTLNEIQVNYVRFLLKSWDWKVEDLGLRLSNLKSNPRVEKYLTQLDLSAENYNDISINGSPTPWSKTIGIIEQIHAEIETIMQEYDPDVESTNPRSGSYAGNALSLFVLLSWFYLIERCPEYRKSIKSVEDWIAYSLEVSDLFNSIQREQH